MPDASDRVPASCHFRCMAIEGPAEETQICRRCGLELPLLAFARLGDNGRQAWCRGCKKAYDAAWYRANREKRRAKVLADQAAFRTWMDGLKEGQPCTDCGLIFPRPVMEWDHLPGTEKLMDLSNARRSAWGKERILAEIAKCELVCANCHRMRTFNRLRENAA
jgi:hypothetical protein